MKINIIIPTRNPSESLFELFNSFIKMGDIIGRVFLINDSPQVESKIIDKLISKFSSNYRIVVVDKKVVESLNIPLKLGPSYWNLGGARNVGLFFSLAFSDKSTFSCFFDDDIIIESVGDLIEYNLKFGKINISGCPDLSRLEWLELYLKYKSGFNVLENPYIEELYSQLSGSVSSLILRYTDLIDEKESNISNISQREELSGGAFICTNQYLGEFFFSNWFDEDWLFFDLIRKNFNTTSNFTGLIVKHNSRKKEILSQESLRFEEVGKIITNTIKYKSPNISLSESLFNEIQKRKIILNKIINKYLTLEGCSDIVISLNNLLTFLSDLNVLELINKIEEYNRLNTSLRYSREEIITKIRQKFL